MAVIEVHEISLSVCKYDKTKKALYAFAEDVGGTLRGEFRITSHHTGEIITFRHIQPSHPLYDEDGWDGEMAVFEPTVPVPNVHILFINWRY